MSPSFSLAHLAPQWYLDGGRAGRLPSADRTEST